MARKPKTSAPKKETEQVTMPSEGPTNSKQYLSELDLRGIKVMNQEASISMLKSEVLALKIRNTELTIKELQQHLVSLKGDIRKVIEEDKAVKENARKNMVMIQEKYKITGKFAYDPLSGELITE